MPPNFEQARLEIYKAHDLDPNHYQTGDGKETPYETHYAQKMETYLHKRAPDASDVLKLAVCGQHFRRWEVPRQDYPMTRIGYHTWRTHLKHRQAQLVAEILDVAGYPIIDTRRCQALIEKEGLKQGEDEVQILEDVACLVFLDDQFEEFKEKHDADKIVNILRKTWGKMSERGHELALEIPMTGECKGLVRRALGE